MNERKISIGITTYNRIEYTLLSFKDVLNDDRILDITINDDFSDVDIFNSLKKELELLNSDKIKLHRNSENLGMSRNKNKTVSLCESDWVILLDSDNVIDKNYIDKLFDIEVWDNETIYCPDRASGFDYTFLDGHTLNKYNITEKLSMGGLVNCLLNTCNYFVNKNKYMETYVYDETIKGSDTIWFNYLWMKNNGSMYVVKGIEYFHRTHGGNEWIKNIEENIRIADEILIKMKNLNNDNG